MVKMEPDSMKHSLVIAACLFCAILSVQGQLLLNQGDSFTYQFATLPQTGSTNAFLTSPRGVFGFTLNAATFQPGEQLRYEMFEHDSSEVPLQSGILSATPPSGATIFSAGAWQDLQGAVRLTMLTGSATVDTISVQAITPSVSLSSLNVNELNFTPTPEPSSLCLGGIAVALLLYRRPRRPRS
jgi:hypothetical protein